MPLVFRGVTTVEGMREMGLLSWTYHMMERLTSGPQRAEFLRERFPDAPYYIRNAASRAVQRAYVQGEAFSAGDTRVGLSDMQTDTSHTVQGRVAYHVEIVVRGYESGRNRGGVRRLATRYTTFYSEQPESLGWVQEQAEQFAAAEQQGRIRNYGGIQESRITNVEPRVISISRSF